MERETVETLREERLTHIIAELKRICDQQEKQNEAIRQVQLDVQAVKAICEKCPREDLIRLRIETAVQKVKTGALSGFFGILGGAIVTIVGFLIKK